MDSFALAKDAGPSLPQFVASAVKFPALFLLTVLITFPSLYVFNALVGSRLTLLELLRLLVAGLGVSLAVLASFGPIVAFFSVSTTSYPFMVLLNVAMCATGGLLGLSFLRQTLHRFTITDATEPERLKAPASASPASPAQPGALEPVGGKVLRPDVRSVFRSWMILFALVGAQMGWALRPFIGHPGRPFTFFRERESNFFAGVWRHFLDLFQ